MAIQDIIAAIIAQADKQIDDARQAHQRSLTEAREAAERNTAKRKQEIALQKQDKKGQLKRKAEAHALAHKRNAILSTKKELLDETYMAVVEELAKLSDADVEPLLRACLKQISEKGTIHPATQHEKILKKICPSEQFKVEKATNAKGGFLFVSDKREADFTFEHLVEEVLRPATELETASNVLS